MKPINWDVFYQGLNIAVFGLIGVFTVLIMFYIVTKLMVHLSNKYDKKDSSS